MRYRLVVLVATCAAAFGGVAAIAYAEREAAVPATAGEMLADSDRLLGVNGAGWTTTSVLTLRTDDTTRRVEITSTAARNGDMALAATVPAGAILTLTVEARRVGDQAYVRPLGSWFVLTLPDKMTGRPTTTLPTIPGTLPKALEGALDELRASPVREATYRGTRVWRSEGTLRPADLGQLLRTLGDDPALQASCQDLLAAAACTQFDGIAGQTSQRVADAALSFDATIDVDPENGRLVHLHLTARGPSLRGDIDTRFTVLDEAPVITAPEDAKPLADALELFADRG